MTPKEKALKILSADRLKSASERLCNYEVEVTDNLDQLIATMTVTGYITGKLHSE